MKATLLSCAALVLVFASCKPKTDEGPDFGQGTGHCRLSSISSKFSSASTVEPVAIEYNSDGRVSKIDNALYHVDLSYNGSLMTITRTYNSSGTVFSNDTLVLLDGRISSIRSYSPNIVTTQVVYTYDGNGVLMGAQGNHGTTNYVEYLKWADGDIVADSTVYPGAVSSVMHYTYYTDKPNQVASALNLGYFLGSGVIPFQSQHLLKSRSDDNGSEELHYYSFDGENKVVKDSVPYAIGGSRYTKTFVYDCK